MIQDRYHLSHRQSKVHPWYLRKKLSCIKFGGNCDPENPSWCPKPVIGAADKILAEVLIYVSKPGSQGEDFAVQSGIWCTLVSRTVCLMGGAKGLDSSFAVLSFNVPQVICDV